MVLFLASCTIQVTHTPEGRNEPAIIYYKITYTPGEWNGSIFKNEHFGFRVNLPDTWEQISASRLTAMGFDPTHKINGFYSLEMAIGDIFGSGAVLLMLESAVESLQNVTAQEYLEYLARAFEASGLHSNIEFCQTPILIGGGYWYYFTSQMGSVRSTILACVMDDVIGSIRIIHVDNDEILHILNMFSGLEGELGQFTGATWPEETAIDTHVTRTPGSWQGLVYTNEFYGLRINMPNDWRIISENDLVNIFGEETLSELFVFDSVDGDWVYLMTEWIEDLSEIEYLEILIEAFEKYGNSYNFFIHPTTISIGYRDWHYLTSNLVGSYMRTVFVSRNGPYMLSIRITHDDEEDLWDILNMFSGLSGALGNHSGLDNRIYRPGDIK